MRLPPGFGSVSKLSGRRRNPYMVRKDGKILGYARTRTEGIEMLTEYNKDPFSLDKSNTTFKDVFDLLIEHKSDTTNPHTLKNYKSKYKMCTELYYIPYKDIRLNHFMGIIDSLNISNGSKNNYRKFFRAMDKVAFEFDLIEKEYSQFIPTFKVDYSERRPFTEEEIKLLWNSLSVDDVDLVLLLLYTGFRSGEFADIKLENIDLEGMTIKGGGKTKAGKNRIVPIHPRILPLLKDRIELAASDTLLNYSDKALRVHFKKVMQTLGLNHIPHECRHTLRTRLDNANANKRCIDLILGHASQGTGERVYTHKTLEQLRETIELLD